MGTIWEYLRQSEIDYYREREADAAALVDAMERAECYGGMANAQADLAEATARREWAEKEL